MSSLSKTPRPLAEGRDDGPVPERDRPSRGGNRTPGSTLGPSTRAHSKHRAGREERRCAKPGEVASVQQSLVHVFGLMRLLSSTYRRGSKVAGRETIFSRKSSPTSRPVSVTISKTTQVWLRKVPKPHTRAI